MPVACQEAQEVLSRVRWRSEKGWIFGYLSACVNLAEAQGDLTAEEQWSRKLVDELPDQTYGYVYLGCCLARQGRLKEAEQTFQQGTECTGCPEEAFYNLGQILCAEAVC